LHILKKRVCFLADAIKENILKGKR
jgi:hypothetical protein